MNAIAIPTFQRVDCLSACLESLKTNPEVAQGGWHIIIYPDFVDAAELAALHSLVSQYPNAKLSTPPTQRLHGCRNILRSVRETFAMGYDNVLRMDSDLHVSPHFIFQLTAARAFSGHPAQSNIHCQLPQPQKPAYRRHLNWGCHSGTNLLISKHEWLPISDLAGQYETAALTLPMEHRSADLGRNWFAARAHLIPDTPTTTHTRNAYLARNTGAGADSFLFFALLLTGSHICTTVVNRAIHASDTGENMTPKLAQALKHVTLDIFDDDAFRTDFKWL